MYDYHKQQKSILIDNLAMDLEAQRDIYHARTSVDPNQRLLGFLASKQIQNGECDHLL